MEFLIEKEWDFVHSMGDTIVEKYSKLLFDLATMTNSLMIRSEISDRKVLICNSESISSIFGMYLMNTFGHDRVCGLWELEHDESLAKDEVVVMIEEEAFEDYPGEKVYARMAIKNWAF